MTWVGRVRAATLALLVVAASGGVAGASQRSAADTPAETHRQAFERLDVDTAIRLAEYLVMESIPRAAASCATCWPRISPGPKATSVPPSCSPKSSTRSSASRPG